MGVFNFNIAEGEQLLVVAKSHWTSYLFSWLKVIIAGAILNAILTFSWPFWWENKWGRIGLLIFIVAGVSYCLVDFWKKFLTTYIVTPCRIIDITQEKILRRVITEINLEEVGGVVLKKAGGLSKLLHKGNIIIKLKNKKGILVLYGVGNPEDVKEKIDTALQETKDIVSKEGKECNVVLEDNRTHSVPLAYSYYGDRKERALNQSGSGRTEKNGSALHRTVQDSGLVVVKKSNKKEK